MNGVFLFEISSFVMEIFIYLFIHLFIFFLWRYLGFCNMRCSFAYYKNLNILWRYLGFCNMQMSNVMTSLIVPQKDKSLNQAYVLEC